MPSGQSQLTIWITKSNRITVYGRDDDINELREYIIRKGDPIPGMAMSTKIEDSAFGN
jgi:hypothetical protein